MVLGDGLEGGCGAWRFGPDRRRRSFCDFVAEPPGVLVSSDCESRGDPARLRPKLEAPSSVETLAKLSSLSVRLTKESWRSIPPPHYFCHCRYPQGGLALLNVVTPT